MQSQISLKLDAPSTPTSSETSPLEDRVAELELKLATLSRLLQQAQRSNVSQVMKNVIVIVVVCVYVANRFLSQQAPFTPPIARPASPPLVLERSDTTPYLESPCPSRRHSSRNLLKEYDAVYVEETATNSMEDNSTTSIGARKKKSDAHVVCTSITETPPPPPPLPETKSVQQKWMDYLNTFQETHHDVDVQMQEFIRVPAQLEVFLGFGWLVCVDCFLYILTILPIRFVWSCILLVSYGRNLVLEKMNKDTSKARFHRR